MIYYEVDYSKVIANKLKIIKSTKELNSMIGSNQRWDDESHTLLTSDYRLAPIDLKAECVIIYIPAESVTAVHVIHENEWICCVKSQIVCINQDGGYAEYVVAPQDSVARVPDSLKFKNAGPLLCAGITVYNSVRRQNLLAGSTVAISGLGGLGHLAIHFFRKMGYETVAISGSSDKRDLALQLGARHYIDSSKEAESLEQLTKLKPKLIVVTAPSAKVIEDILPSLAIGGKLLILGAVVEPLKVNALQLLSEKQSIIGWSSGDSRDSEDTLKFAANNDIQTMVEVFPLAKANEAIEKMLANKIRFRGVISLVSDEELEQ